MRRVATGFGLLEAARWYPDLGLVFSDMTRGGVFRLADPDAAPTPVIPHRKGIGGLVRHAEGGFVVAGRNVAYKADDGTTTVLLAPQDDEQFFNDLTADGRGQVYVGSVAVDPLAEPPAAPLAGGPPVGRLYRIGVDGRSTVLADDVITSNGLGVDPSEAVLYHVDTGRRLVWRLPLGADRGQGREQFVDTSEYAGEPDGLAVAEDGSVWVAMAGGGAVVAWDAAGRRVAEVELPQPLATAVCLGGRDRADLYALTGATVRYPDPDGGGIYVGRAPVAGLPAPFARVAIPRSGGSERGEELG